MRDSPSDRVSYASATSRNLLVASGLSGFLSGCHFLERVRYARLMSLSEADLSTPNIYSRLAHTFRYAKEEAEGRVLCSSLERTLMVGCPAPRSEPEKSRSAFLGNVCFGTFRTPGAAGQGTFFQMTGERKARATERVRRDREARLVIFHTHSQLEGWGVCVERSCEEGRPKKEDKKVSLSGFLVARSNAPQR